MRIADRINPPVNVVISNVPGPNHPLYSAGAELKHFYPVSTISDGIGLNLTVQSYNGQLDFGFVGDRDLVPDVWLLIDLLHEEMEELHGRAISEQADVSAEATRERAQPEKDREEAGAERSGGQEAGGDYSRLFPAATVHSPLSARWLLAPAGVLAAMIAALLAWGVRSRLRYRRALRRYQELLGHRGRPAA